MKTTKLNESFYKIEGTHKELEPITKQLQAERPGAYFEPMVKRGLKSPYDVFYTVQDAALIVPSGLVQFIGHLGVKGEAHTPEYTFDDVQSYLGTLDLPFPPYRHQVSAFYDSLLKGTGINIMATASGKSLTISLLADFFRLKGMKGILIVPNINLLTQFKSDIKDYNLMNLYNNIHVIGGGNTDKHFNMDLTISTWQSLMDYKEDLSTIDYVIVDECHKAKATQLMDIVQKASNARYKFGFTGTLNDSAPDRMALFGLFGRPKTYIRTQGLIDQGLATPVEINAIHLLYSDQDRKLFRSVKGYAKQLQFIKEHENRNKFISILACTLASKGNNLTLFQHTVHGKELFTMIMKTRHPDIEVTNKDIVGKKAWDFQKKHKVYYIAGEVKGKVREQVRQILEESPSIKITLEDDSVILLDYDETVTLEDNTTKLASDLDENDSISDDFIKCKHQ